MNLVERSSGATLAHCKKGGVVYLCSVPRDKIGEAFQCWPTMSAEDTLKQLLHVASSVSEADRKLLSEVLARALLRSQQIMKLERLCEAIARAEADLGVEIIITGRGMTMKKVGEKEPEIIKTSSKKRTRSEDPEIIENTPSKKRAIDDGSKGAEDDVL